MTESEKRHLNVILEEMSGKLNLVLEGHAALDGKIERYHKEAKEDHRLAMDLIKFSHDSLKSEIQGVDKKLTSEIRAVGEKVEGHEARISMLERKVA